jgi:outer membrane protein TolC
VAREEVPDRAEDLIVVRTEHLLSAAFAALLVTGPLCAQTRDTVTAVTLDQALTKSRAVAPSVVQAQGSIRNAELNTRSAFLQFLPQLQFNPQAALTINSAQHIDPITGELINGNSSLPQYSFGIGASYTIFDGFARNYRLRQQRAVLAGANASLTSQEFSSDYSTTDAFFTALADKQLVAVSDTNVRATEAQLRLSSAKLNAGSGSLSDSLTAAGNYLQAKLQLLQAQNNLIVGESQLGRYVGVSGRVAAIDDSAFYTPPGSLDTASLRKEVLTTAPALLSMQQNLTAAQQAYKASKAGYYPTLTAAAAQSWTGAWAGDQAKNGLTPRHTISLALSFSPWTNLTREQQIDAADVQILTAEAELEDQRNVLAATVNQQFAAIATAQESINVSEAAVEAGNENLRVVTERYRIGVAIITEVLTAQNQLTQAEVSQVQARYSYLRAKAQLEQILGRKL